MCPVAFRGGRGPKHRKRLFEYCLQYYSSPAFYVTKAHDEMIASLLVLLATSSAENATEINGFYSWNWGSGCDLLRCPRPPALVHVLT